MVDLLSNCLFFGGVGAAESLAAAAAAAAAADEIVFGPSSEPSSRLSSFEDATAWL